jgi:hypothetical protein
VVTGLLIRTRVLPMWQQRCQRGQCLQVDDVSMHALGNDTATKRRTAGRREGMRVCCKGVGRGVRSFRTNRLLATARPQFHTRLQLKCWGVSRGASSAAGQSLATASRSRSRSYFGRS